MNIQLRMYSKYFMCEGRLSKLSTLGGIKAQAENARRVKLCIRSDQSSHGT